MFPIDIRTAVFFTFLVSAVATTGVFSLWLRDRRGYLLDFSAGHAALALGFLLVSLRGQVSDLLSIVAGNDLLLVGLITFHQGVTRFTGRRVWHLAGMALVALQTAGLAWFTWRHPDTSARVVLVALLCSLPCAAICVRLGQDLTRRTLFVHLVAAGPLGLFALFQWWRALVTLREPLPGDFMSAGQLHGATFLVATLLVTATLIGFSGLHIQRLLQQLEDQARIDPLTGLVNRRSLEEAASREVSRALRATSQLCVLMIDIDHFKRVNDTGGHQAGDEVLRQLGGLIQQTLRPYDVAARYGGEEFCVLLPLTDPAVAGKVAERLRLLASSEIDGPDGPVTISVGVSALAPGERDWRAANQRADEALYEAKRGGRDRVVQHWALAAPAPAARAHLS